jgi:peptidyl-prolyl cis-trans isomerase D
MLKVMRDQFKYLQWLLWVVIFVFVLFVFVDFGGTVSNQGLPNEAAATVAGEPISYAAYERSYRQLEDQYRQMYGEGFTPEIAERMQLPLQALDRLVNQAILLREAERLELTASDEEVRREILSVPGFKDASGRFIGEQLYDQVLRQNGYTPASFESEVRRQILLEKLNSVLAQSVVVTDAEVERAHRDEVEKAKIRYLLLEPGSQPLSAPATDAQLEAYYQQHLDDFRLPERRVVSYLVVDQNQVRASVDVPRSEIEAYHQGNQDQFRRPDEVRARHLLVAVNETRSDEQALAEATALRARLAAGEDFAALAAAHSDDPSNKDRGGDLGWFAREAMVQEFSDAAFGAEPGALVGPVKTSYGYHLIEVLEKRAAGVRPLAEVESEIRSRLAAERAESVAEGKARELHRRAVERGAKSADDLRAVVGNDPVVAVETSQPFSQKEGVGGAGRNSPLVTAAFALQPGGISEPLKVPRGWTVAVLQEVQPPRLQTLAEVRDRVRGVVEREQRIDVARARLELERNLIARGEKTLDDAATALGGVVQESMEFGANAPITGLGILPEVNRLAMSTALGQVAGPVVTPRGAVLLQVVERKQFDPAAFAAQKPAVRERLEGERLNRLLAAMIGQRRQELDVRYDDRLVDELGITQNAPAGA